MIPLKKILVIIIILTASITCHLKALSPPPQVQEYYLVRIYNISKKTQGERIDKFLKDAYIPALHRAGFAKIGVFKPVEKDTLFHGRLIYLFVPLRSLDQFDKLPLVLNNDKEYVQASGSFIDAPFNDPPYDRFENILLKAFINWPKFRAPAYTNKPGERVYELRSYESATEAKALKKIEMFNQGGEIAIFEKLGFNPVFFGEVLAGSHMPNLMYMTTFENMESHDAHWASFQNSPDWKTLKGMEEYQNTTSKVTPFMLLSPADYSDF